MRRVPSPQSYRIHFPNVTARENYTLRLELPIQWHNHILPLHTLFEALGYTLGYQAYRHLKKIRGDFLNPEWRFQLVIAAILGALVGSKIPGLIDHLVASQLDRPWLSSKTVAGGLLGGLVSVEWVKARLGIQRATGDLWVQPVIVGIMVGRIGCFLAGPSDGTWGKATSSFLGIDTGTGIAYHPAPLYEIFFLAICSLGLARLAHGRIQWNRYRLFLILYLAFRFGIDFIKLDPKIAMGLTSIQWMALLGILGLALEYHHLFAAAGNSKGVSP